MQTRLSNSLITALLLSTGSVTQAAENAGIDGFSARVEVADQSQAQKNRGLAQAFEEIMIKLSGQRHARLVENFEQELRRSKNWVTSVSYEDRQVPGAESTSVDQTRLMVQFDKFKGQFVGARQSF